LGDFFVAHVNSYAFVPITKHDNCLLLHLPKNAFYSSFFVYGLDDTPTANANKGYDSKNKANLICPKPHLITNFYHFMIK
jgi:hypothetical protein